MVFVRVCLCRFGETRMFCYCFISVGSCRFGLFFCCWVGSCLLLLVFLPFRLPDVPDMYQAGLQGVVLCPGLLGTLFLSHAFVSMSEQGGLY